MDEYNVFKRNAHDNQCLTFGKLKLCEFNGKEITGILHQFNLWRCTDDDVADNTLDGDLYLSLDCNNVHLRSLNRLKYLRLVVGTHSKRINYPRNTAFVDHESKIAVAEYSHNHPYPISKLHILDLETNKFLHNLSWEEAQQIIPQYADEINKPRNYIKISFLDVKSVIRSIY